MGKFRKLYESAKQGDTLSEAEYTKSASPNDTLQRYYTKFEGSLKKYTDTAIDNSGALQHEDQGEFSFPGTTETSFRYRLIPRPKGGNKADLEVIVQPANQVDMDKQDTIKIGVRETVTDIAERLPRILRRLAREFESV